jgi:hypothetical protein
LHYLTYGVTNFKTSTLVKTIQSSPSSLNWTNNVPNLQMF